MGKSTNSEKIQILLHEYDSIRNHIISRTSTAVQVAAIGVGALLVGVPQSNADFCVIAAMIAFVFVAMALIIWVLVTDLIAESRHVAHLERVINHLAEEEELLSWESRQGVSHGLIRPLRRWDIFIPR
jgi:hypothetical protein